jgi:hypothetical protein
MERLTKHSKQTSHENGICCTHFRGPECLEVGGNCAMNCKWEEAAWSRLAAYEDTGLTPEEFAAYWVFIQDLIGDQKASETLSHLRHLAQADKAGRLVVLPCKVGTATYYIHYPIAVYPDESEPEIKRGIFTLCDLDRVGHSVFLTREEAEKALEAMKDGN